MRPKVPNAAELRIVHDKELELRRLSGEISCTNCRRLKVKCDKKLPCTTCVTRGAGAFCPLGTDAGSIRDNLAPLDLRGTAYTSGSLKRKLNILSERIRVLEDALAIESEARNGPGSHPLLTDGQLAIKQCIIDDEGNVDQDEDEETEEILGSFGTLSVDEDTRTMRYLGPAASESALIMKILEGDASHPNYSAYIGSIVSDTISASTSFPFAISPLRDEQALLSQLVTYLPPYERATALCEAFFGNLSWLFAPIERSQYITDIMPLFYPGRKPIKPMQVRVGHAHDLALLLAVFACGAVGDLTQNPINDEAENYHALAKAAISAKSIMSGASLTGVQTLFMLGLYDMFSGRKKSNEDKWKFMSLGSIMAADIGLHRDPARWNLEAKTLERRRRVFWDIYFVDVERSLENGRPAIFRASVIDCEFPVDQVMTVAENGEMVEGVPHWTYRFLKDILSDACEKICSARQLKYREVLDFDRKIRDFPPHPSAELHRPCRRDLGIEHEFDRLYPLVTVWLREKALIAIHRNFFARAILDFPQNPMRSPFAASFFAAYRSACTITRLVRENMESIYLIVLRLWPIWSSCLVCGVIIGTVASLSSPISFSASAFKELEHVIAIFEKYDGHTVSRHGLPLLRRMREKALRALRQPRIKGRPNDRPAGAEVAIPSIRVPHENVDEELLILRGTTRLVEQRASILPEVQSDDSASRSQIPAAYQEIPELASPEYQSSPNIMRDTPANEPCIPSSGLSPTVGLYAFSGTEQTQRPSGASVPRRIGDYQFSQASESYNVYQGAPATEIDTDFSRFVPGFMPFQNLPPAASTANPDMFLDEATSTDAWQTFMRQAGFLDYDIGIGDARNGSSDPLMSRNQW